MLKIAEFLLKTYYKTFYKIEVKNKALLKDVEGMILAGNHTSNHDPVIFRIFTNLDLRFIAKEELFKVPLLNKFLLSIGTIPVKRGTFDRNCINTSIEVIKNGGNIGIFPEGTRVHNPDFKVGSGHAGVSLLASRANAKVLTFAIIPEKHFRLFSTVRIIIGEAIDVISLKEQGLKHDDITNHIMQSIQNIIDQERKCTKKQ